MNHLQRPWLGDGWGAGPPHPLPSQIRPGNRPAPIIVVSMPDSYTRPCTQTRKHANRHSKHRCPKIFQGGLLSLLSPLLSLSSPSPVSLLYLLSPLSPLCPLPSLHSLLSHVSPFSPHSPLSLSPLNSSSNLRTTHCSTTSRGRHDNQNDNEYVLEPERPGAQYNGAQRVPTLARGLRMLAVGRFREGGCLISRRVSRYLTPKVV